MGWGTGTGRGAVLGEVKERQVNMRFPDLGFLSGLSPRAGGLGEGGAGRKEANLG